MVNSKSDYGKGLTICLAKFMEHFGYESLRKIHFINMYRNKTEVEQEAMLSDNPPDNLDYGELNGYLRYFIEDILPLYDNDIDKALSHSIELWARDASDYIHEIEVPNDEIWDEIRDMVAELKERITTMAYGLKKNIIWKLVDVVRMKQLTLEILYKLDKKIGLQPDIGKW